MEALRVAQAELNAGNTSGKVFMQHSPGAAMILTERAAAKEAVASEIRQIILGEELMKEDKNKKR